MGTRGPLGRRIGTQNMTFELRLGSEEEADKYSPGTRGFQAQGQRLASGAIGAGIGKEWRRDKKAGSQQEPPAWGSVASLRVRLVSVQGMSCHLAV